MGLLCAVLAACSSGDLITDERLELEPLAGLEAKRCKVMKLEVSAAEGQQ